MQGSYNLTQALICIGDDIGFWQANNSPSALSQESVFLAVFRGFTGERVPVGAVTLNGDALVNERKIHDVLTDVVLLGVRQPFCIKQRGHRPFKAANTINKLLRPDTSATMGADAKSVNERWLDHADFAAHSARKRSFGLVQRVILTNDGLGLIALCALSRAKQELPAFPVRLGKQLPAMLAGVSYRPRRSLGDSFALQVAESALLILPLKGNGLATRFAWRCVRLTLFGSGAIEHLPARSASLNVRGTHSIPAIHTEVLVFAVSSRSNRLSSTSSIAELPRQRRSCNREEGSATLTSQFDRGRLGGHSDDLLLGRWGAVPRGVPPPPGLSHASIIPQNAHFMGFSQSIRQRSGREALARKRAA